MNYTKTFIAILLLHITISCGPDDSSSINAACESTTDKTKSEIEREKEKAALYEAEEAAFYEGEEAALYEGEEAEETNTDTKKKTSESDTCTTADKEDKVKNTNDTKDTKG